jgi:hypothetical protein
MTALPYACHVSTSSIVKIIWPIVVPVVMTFSLYNMGFSNCRSNEGEIKVHNGTRVGEDTTFCL